MNGITLRLACFASCAALAACVALPAAAFTIDFHMIVMEYVNDITGHYFIADGSDAAVLDSGRAGAGWQRTGHEFSVWKPGSGTGVCRFYAPGPNTHFFTASADECNLFRAHPEWGWIYEGVKFGVDVPSGGSCSGRGAPVNRYYNNRSLFNDSNHRYVDAADTDSRADLQARGWTDEGVVFCVEYTTRVAAKSFVVDSATTTSTTRPLAECRDPDVVRGTCMALDGIAGPMRNVIRPSQPPWFPVADPQWSRSFSDLTGVEYPLYTAQSIDDSAAVAAHSFVQLWGTGLGLRTSSLDHYQGNVGSIDPMFQFATRAPSGFATDERVFPWRLPRENSVVLSFDMIGVDTRKSDTASHAWGAPMIEFQDAASGQSVDVTLQTFGTIPPGDFVGAVDPANDHVFVSTVFRANPAFGTRVSGDFIPCAGDGSCSSRTSYAHYSFRIARGDFAKVLAFARAANPGLSADPTDYFLVNFRFQNGILGNASAGVGLGDLHLDLFGY